MARETTVFASGVLVGAVIACIAFTVGRFGFMGFSNPVQTGYGNPVHTGYANHGETGLPTSGSIGGLPTSGSSGMPGK